MKKRIFVLLSILAVLYCATSFAQDVIPVFNDSQAQEQAAATNPPDTPVSGIGDTLTGAYLDFMQTIATATSGIGSSLTASFRDLARKIVVLYIVFVAYQLGRGNIEAWKPAITTMVLVVVVTGIVFESGKYQDWVAGPIIGTITDLSNYLVTKATGSATGGMFQVLSSGMDKIMAVSVKMDQAVPVYKVHLLLLAAITEILLTGTYLAVMVVFILLNVMMWCGIYLLNVFGAISLYFVIFNYTRNIFFAWLRAICNYGLTLAFASLIMGVCLKILNPALDKLIVMDYGSVHPLLNAPTYTCIAINVLTWCMLLKATDFAAALTGGSAGNTAGIAGVVSMTAGAVYGGAKWAVYRGMGRAGAAGAAGAVGLPGGGTMGRIARAAGAASARKGIVNH